MAPIEGADSIHIAVRQLAGRDTSGATACSSPANLIIKLRLITLYVKTIHI